MTIRSLARRSRVARYMYTRSYALKAFTRAHSFAEAREDILVQQIIGKVAFFVDIGAHDGISGSNTFHFARQGARGVCFEPVRWTFEKLRSLYGFNRRVVCRNVGISDRTRELEIMAADFYSYLPETVDTQRPIPPLKLKPERIRLQTFADAIDGLDIPDIVDLLSIDVEGHELNVLHSIPFNRYKFRAIVLETHLQNADGSHDWKHRDLEAIESLLSAQGYVFVRKTRVNTIYLACPPSSY